jgi:hypothetical protein
MAKTSLARVSMAVQGLDYIRIKPEVHIYFKEIL